MRPKMKWLLWGLVLTLIMVGGAKTVGRGQPRHYPRPIMPADSIVLADELERYGTACTDRLVRWTERSTLVACPFYSATLDGRPLTHHLLARQHEAALALLGYSDNDPYDMTVVVAIAEVGTHGVMFRDWRYEPPVTKAAFDSLYGEWTNEVPGKFSALANPPPPTP